MDIKPMNEDVMRIVFLLDREQFCRVAAVHDVVRFVAMGKVHIAAFSPSAPTTPVEKQSLCLGAKYCRERKDLPSVLYEARRSSAIGRARSTQTLPPSGPSLRPNTTEP